MASALGARPGPVSSPPAAPCTGHTACREARRQGAVSSHRAPGLSRRSRQHEEAVWLLLPGPRAEPCWPPPRRGSSQRDPTGAQDRVLHKRPPCARETEAARARRTRGEEPAAAALSSGPRAPGPAQTLWQLFRESDAASQNALELNCSRGWRMTSNVRDIGRHQGVGDTQTPGHPCESGCGVPAPWPPVPRCPSLIR